jgi:hypothetical protein
LRVSNFIYDLYVNDNSLKFFLLFLQSLQYCLFLPYLQILRALHDTSIFVCHYHHTAVISISVCYTSRSCEHYNPYNDAYETQFKKLIINHYLWILPLILYKFKTYYMDFCLPSEQILRAPHSLHCDLTFPCLQIALSLHALHVDLRFVMLTDSARTTLSALRLLSAMLADRARTTRLTS